MYGRELEIKALTGEVDAVASRRKNKSINFVSGISGIGKTDIVMEVMLLLTTSHLPASSAATLFTIDVSVV